MNTNSERDYATEMRGFIDKEVDASREPYEPRIAASKAVQQLRETDADLLAGWLNAQAEQFVWQLINDRDRSARSHARSAHGRSVFRKAAEDHAGGDEAALVGWLTVPYTVADCTRKALGDLTAEDLRFVAVGYQRRSDENAFEAAFHLALAKKVGRRTVRAVYSSEQIDKLRDSIAQIQGRGA